MRKVEEELAGEEKNRSQRKEVGQGQTAAVGYSIAEDRKDNKGKGFRRGLRELVEE